MCIYIYIYTYLVFASDPFGDKLKARSPARSLEFPEAGVADRAWTRASLS